MQRYHVPFDHIERDWTASQTICLMAAMKENEVGGRRGTGLVALARRLTGRK